MLNLELNGGRLFRYLNTIVCFYIVLDPYHTTSNQDISYFTQRFQQEQHDLQRLMAVVLEEFVVKGKRQFQQMCTDSFVLTVKSSGYQYQSLKQLTFKMGEEILDVIYDSLRFEILFIDDHDEETSEQVVRHPVVSTPALHTAKHLSFSQDNKEDDEDADKENVDPRLIRQTTIVENNTTEVDEEEEDEIEEFEDTFESLVDWWNDVFTGELLSQQYCEIFDEKFARLTPEDQQRMRQFLKNQQPKREAPPEPLQVKSESKQRKSTGSTSTTPKGRIQQGEQQRSSVKRQSFVKSSAKRQRDIKSERVIPLSDEEDEYIERPRKRVSRKLLPSSQQWME